METTMTMMNTGNSENSSNSNDSWMTHQQNSFLIFSTLDNFFILLLLVTISASLFFNKYHETKIKK